jgi:YD repeat-containing protein
VSVENNAGERIEYVRNGLGNITKRVVRGSLNGTIVQSQTAQFDELGRLLKSIGGTSAQTTAYAYDKNSNLTKVTDNRGEETMLAYDALDRLISTTDSLGGVVSKSYDAADNVTAVQDARGVVTTYTYNGFNEVISESSPDIGTVTYTRDSAGNIISRTDARGVVTNYTHDALNRVMAVGYPGNPAENVAYSYDATASNNKGIGRLTGITDESGSQSFVYDARGNVISNTRVMKLGAANTSFTTAYSYDAADNLISVTYPSGRVVTYTRNNLGQIATVSTTPPGGGTAVVVANDITYMPFGALKTLSFGNGVV